VVRCTFSPVRAWRLAVGPASTRTLGLATESVQCSSRISACRRELNSHEAAADSEEAGRRATPRCAAAPSRGIGKHKDRRLVVGTTLTQVAKAMTGNRRAASEHRAAWEAIIFSRFVGSATGASADSQGSRRLECWPRHRRRRGVGRRRGGAPETTKASQVQAVARRARPNPSSEARPNGIAPGPRGTKAYHVLRGPGAMPLVPPQLER